MEAIADSGARLCILDDFNLPQLNWDLFLYPDNHLYSSAASLVCNHGSTQLVDEPTRGDNILDLVLCSDTLCADYVTVLYCLLWETAIIRWFLLSYVCLSISRPHQSAQLDLTFPGPIGLVYAVTYPRLTGSMWSTVEQYWDSFYILSVLGLTALSLVLLGSTPER